MKGEVRHILEKMCSGVACLWVTYRVGLRKLSDHKEDFD